MAKDRGREAQEAAVAFMETVDDADVAAFRARREAIERAIRRARIEHGLPGEGTRILAVSKRQPPHLVAAALAAGHRLFGENRLQEAVRRWAGARERLPDLALHFIGHLQSNKAQQAVALFDCIESVDRPSLVEALARAVERTGRRPRLLVQVNTGAEPQKGGVLPADLPRLLALMAARDLVPEGLMCIPPRDEEPALHFALLKKLARRHGLAVLSMGMSGDFETAAAMDADHVRIGTALFGSRPAG